MEFVKVIHRYPKKKEDQNRPKSSGETLVVDFFEEGGNSTPPAMGPSSSSQPWLPSPLPNRFPHPWYHEPSLGGGVRIDEPTCASLPPFRLELIRSIRSHSCFLCSHFVGSILAFRNCSFSFACSSSSTISQCSFRRFFFVGSSIALVSSNVIRLGEIASALYISDWPDSAPLFWYSGELKLSLALFPGDCGNVVNVFPLRFGVFGEQFLASSSSVRRTVPLREGLLQAKAEKRERTGWATCLVKRGRIIGRQTLATWFSI